MAFQGHKTKEVLTLIARLPLVLTVLLLSYPARGLWWIVCKLQAADLRIVTWAAGFPETGFTPYPAAEKNTTEFDGYIETQYDSDPVPVLSDQELLPDLDEILMSIRIQPKVCVDQIRIELEASELGQKAKANCKDRRLYAVLKPTKEENLRRIENIFRAMTPEQFDNARRVSKEHLGL